MPKYAVYFMLLCILTLLSVSNDISAQSREKSSLYTSSFVLDTDSTLILPYTIAPHTLTLISHYAKEKPKYQIDDNKLNLQVQERDSVTLKCRILPYQLGTTAQVMNPDDINKKSRIIKIGNDYSTEEENSRRFIESNKIDYTGSFTRGINVGNTQDLVLESDFNLQMTGDLGNGLNIRAAISDDNIPIQPEGNTQVLQEFDKVYIEVAKDNTSVIAGDYELGKPDSYFVNYYKKLKGLTLSNSTFSKGWQLNNKGSFAISRGKFNRLELQTKEGNQGPYKLEGNNNELFLQILSGTEKVFADGKLLRRGETNDYVIDYNRAEIRFTPSFIMTANTRIIIEYEYATQDFLRSLYATESSFTKNKITLGFNFYNEQDSKSLTGNIQLDSTDIRAIELSGDSTAFRSGIFIPEDNNFENLIQYRREANNLVYAPMDSLGLVAATFSNLGVGQGAYIIDSIAGANGRVYRYVGEGLGSFDTLIPLPIPEKRQLMSATLNYKASDSTAFYVETALSNDDRNRLSTRGNENNIGYAITSGFSDTRIIKKTKNTESDYKLTNKQDLDTKNTNIQLQDSIQKDSIKLSKRQIPRGDWTLNSTASIELSQRNFVQLNPYRPTEFNRDWNLGQAYDKSNEILYNAGFKINNNRLRYGYQLSGFENQNLYAGLKHNLNLSYLHKGWKIDGEYNLLNSDSFREKTKFERPKLLISKAFYEKWTLGAYYEKENNVREIKLTDSLNPLSQNYDLYKIFASTDDSRAFNITASYTLRNDDRVIDKSLAPVTTSDDYTLSGNWSIGDYSILNFNTTYRDYRVITDDPDYNRLDESKQTFIGTINHKLNLLKKGLVLSSFYEANSGQEPKLEFQYIEVQRGEGSYQWIDSNADSIQQINEFQIAPFADLASFEKISIFNNEFISTNKIVLNESLRIIPKKFFKNKNHLLGKFQITSRLRIDQRTSNASSSSFIKPITFDLNDTTLVSFNSSMDHNLFFNRGQTKWDLQLAYRELRNKIVQVTGFEIRASNEYYGKIRYNFFKMLDVIIENSQGNRRYESENFEIQNYDIKYKRITPQLNYRPNPKFRITAKYKIEKNENTLGAEVANINDIGLSLTWRKSSKSSLQASSNIVLIEYLGSNNTPVQFEILQGLNDGNNYLWNINYTRRVSKNFDLIFNYNGRKSEDARMVNNAGLQLRAIF